MEQLERKVIVFYTQLFSAMGTECHTDSTWRPGFAVWDRENDGENHLFLVQSFRLVPQSVQRRESSTPIWYRLRSRKCNFRSAR